jgi:hypothetical protein
MRKKLFLAFTLALLLVLVFCATAAADSSGQCGEHVYWAKDDNGVVTLSGTGPTYNYYWNNNLSPFDHDATVTAVVVEPGVTTLGECLFYGCENLASVSLPDGLTRVCWLSLSGTALTELVLPASVAAIDSNAVQSNVLESVYVYNPDMSFPAGTDPIDGINGMTYYGYPGSTTEEFVNNAFFTYYFMDITIEITEFSCGDHAYWAKDANGVVTISGTGPMWDNWRYSASRLDNDSPFHNDATVTAAVIEPGITTLGRNTFDGCANLTSVSLPDGLERINTGSLYGTALSELVLPASVTEIEENALSGGSTLTDVYVYNPDMIFGTGLDSFNGSGTTFHGFAGSTTETYVANAWGGYAYRFEPFPDSSGQCGDNVYWAKDANGVVTIIGTGPMWDYHWNSNPSPFESDQTVTAAVIGSGVTTVGAWFFDECYNLVSVEFQETLASLGYGAFYGCTSLTSIELPAGLTSIGVSAFFDCTSLASIELPASLTSLGNWAFRNCTALTSIELPSGLTSLGYGAFYGCTSLTSIKLPLSLTSIDYGAFYGCTSLTNVELPLSLTSIGDEAFSGCKSLTSVELPASLTSIGDEAFYDCTALEAVTVLNTDTVFGEDIFQGTGENLTIFGYTGSTAESYATANSIPFVPLDAPAFFLPAALTALEDEAFAGIAARSVVIPKTVTSITGDPFAGSQVTTIYGYPDTPAQTFAAAKGYNFVAITDALLAAFRG